MSASRNSCGSTGLLNAARTPSLIQVRGEEDRLAALPDVGDQLPDHVTCLRIESGGHLVEKEHFRIVDHGQCDEQSLLLASGERHEPGVTLGLETESSQEILGVDHSGIEGRPQVDSLPDLDSLLELGLLMLDADPTLKRQGVPSGIEAQY